MFKWKSIQVLRALAALAVVAFHAHWLSIGFSGVDVFFVISGFIMGTVGLKERPGQFVARRLIRIVPLYWLMTLTLCGFSLIPGLMAHFHFTPLKLAQSLMFMPYRANDGTITPLVVQGWTLNYEMLFYVIFSAGLCLPRPRLATGVVIVLLVAAGAWLKPSNPALITWTSPILLEFAAGLALSACPARLPKWTAWSTSLLGFAILAALPFSGSLDYSGWRRAIELGLPALMIVAGALGVEWAGGLGNWPPQLLAMLILLGDASYALYLIQGLILPACEKALRHWPMIGGLAGIVLSVVAGVICHTRLEKPLSRWLLGLNQRLWGRHAADDPIAKVAA